MSAGTGDRSAEHAIADEAIAAELAALARGTAPELWQFASLAGAQQYLGLYRLWRRHVPAGSTTLDWGAGNGHFSYFLLRTGYRATAYSFETSGFSRWLPAGDYRFVPAQAGEPRRLPFAEASFDAVASVGVLEHVREKGGDEAASLAEIARVLKPGGVFVCWHLPNRWSWIDFGARLLPGAVHHTWRYSLADVRGLVAAAGLELVDAGRYGFLPRNIVHRLIGPSANAPGVAAAWNVADAVLGAVLSPVVQNLYFVARRPSAYTTGAKGEPQ
jgi:SAM-dependent methyltransferase